MIKSISRSIFEILPASIKDEIRWKKNQLDRKTIIRNWENSGKPIPTPHQVKQINIEKYQKEFGYNILVETGTFLGEMVTAQRKNFKKIYSIELGFELWEKAVKKFKGYPHIEILQGDSGKVLDQIVVKLNEPAIFWLDGHYSGGFTAKGEKECPIYGEIDSIFKGKKLNHVILVDDARCFNGEGDYPTIEDLRAYIQSKDSSYTLENRDDILCFTIKK